MSAMDDIQERAARWVLLRESPDWSDADQVELDGWLDQSMSHKAAYWRLEHGWREADRIGSLGAYHEARSGARWWDRRWQALAIAASLLLAVGLGFHYLMPAVSWPDGAHPSERTRYATPVGGRKVLTLADGSRVELNTATSVRAAVTPSRREFWLDRGEAYFDVAHAPDRPFVVHAGSRKITVLGTKFSIRRDGDRVTVSVLEGRVRIEPVDPSTADEGSQEQIGGRSWVITDGDVAIAEGASTLVATNSPARVETGLSWRRGILTFNQSTLASAATEFNRYNSRRIVISDPETAAIRIGGTFQARNVDAFVRLLRDAYGLQVEVEGEEMRISG